MTTFNEANKVRTALKMKLSDYHWYNGSVIYPEKDGYSVLISVKKMNNNVRKIISPVIDGVSVRVESEC